MGKVDDSSFFEWFSAIDDDNDTFMRAFSGDFDPCSQGKLSMGYSKCPFFQNLHTGCFVAVKARPEPCCSSDYCFDRFRILRSGFCGC